MGSGYEISVDDALRVVETLNGLLADFDGATREAGRVLVPAAAFGQVGSTAAGAGTTAHTQLITTLQALATVLKTLNQRIRTSADGYAGHDRQIAGVLNRMTAAERPF
jgi:excreted virulence factor EspC (type VII ESX diderm)